MVHIGHTDDELEIAIFEFGQGFILGCYLGEARGIAQIERSVLVEDFFIYSAVVFEHEGVVLGGDKKDVVNSFVHQICEGRISEH